MSTEKNTFKKSDANGNKLDENIGQGLNFDHPSPEIRTLLEKRMNFLINESDKKEFIEFCKPFGGYGTVLRSYIKNCIKK